MAATRESGAAMRKTQAEGKGAYATLGAGAEKALKAISVASGVAAVASIMLATKFDAAMERVHTQAGASQAEVEKMSGAMLDLAPKVGTGPEALAESLFHVESVGLRGAKALDTVAASAKLAKVGNADLEQTTNAVAAAFVTQMKDARSLNQIVGLLNATIGQGNMKMNDLTAAISTGILSVAKNFGLGLADVAGALTLMNNLTNLDEKTKGVTAGVNKFGEAWAKTQRTAKFQWDQLKASMESAGVKLGNVLLPSVLRIAGAVGKVADAFGHLPSGIQGTIVTVGLLAYPVMKVTKAILAGRDAWIAWRAAAVSAEAAGGAAQWGAIATGAGTGAVAMGGLAAAGGAVGLAIDQSTKSLGYWRQKGVEAALGPVGVLGIAVTGLRQSYDAMTGSGHRAASATAAATTTYDQANAALLTGKHSALGYADGMRTLGGGTTAATAALHAQHPAMITIKNDVDKAIPLFGGYSNASRVSATTVIGHLRQERDEFRTWASDTRTLLKRGLDPKIVQALSTQGPQYVHAFVTASDGKLKDLATVFGQRADAAGDAAKTELAKKGAEAGAAAARAAEASFKPYLVAYYAVIAASPGSGAHASERERMAGGGVLREPVLGVGMRSGKQYSLGEAGPEAVVPLGGHGHGGARGGGGGFGIGQVTININGAGDPHRTALAVREELLKLGRRNPSIWSARG